MSDLALPPEAVEAAAKEIHRQDEHNRAYKRPWNEARKAWNNAVEAGIHAFLDAMGVTVEERPGSKYYGYEKPPLCRFVSPWFPVEDNASKEAAQ